MPQSDAAILNLRRLNEISRRDSVYNGWKQSRDSSAAAFEAFANSQPEDIRNMLWSYADGTQMMLQRKVYIACKCMNFKD